MAKERRWRELVRRQAASGLSVRAFCRRERLSEPSFHVWRRTIRQRDGATMPRRTTQTAAFVPAVVTSGPPHKTSIALELPGGGVLRFLGPTATEQLAELVVALQARAAVVEAAR
ncbi:MAG: IS66 family insertion sequence element accessory protein TnpA [Phycisphaerae bacterium]